jgi:hypothetical protein
MGILYQAETVLYGAQQLLAMILIASKYKMAYALSAQMGTISVKT